MNKTAFKIAASTTMVAVTMVGFTSQSEAMRRFGAAVKADAPADRDAARLHDEARRALQAGRLADALVAIENAVAAAPRDVGYRLLLADVYMKSGRFESARASFADVLELDPSNVRAGLSFALMQIALGRPAAAVAQLDELNGRAAAADLGLAYALAGQPERGIDILEPEARSLTASPRLRQNLALSYALAGDWQRARAVASQDVSPADLGPRLQQWAALARPEGRSAQVATLLGVVPVAGDPGQPVRLALTAPAPAPVAPQQAFAAAEPVYQPVAEPVAEPIQVAEAAQPVSDWGVAPSPEPAPVEVAEAPSYYLPPPPPVAPAEPEAPAPSEEQVRYAMAARTLTTPEPAVVRRASSALPTPPVFRREAPRVVAEVRRGDSQFVVQLGSFAIEGNAERMWVQAHERFGLDDYHPLTTTFEHQGRTLHRVSIAGFDSHADAQRLCSSIKASGGACFVRASAGDAAVRWAARYAPDRNRRA